MMTDIAPEQVVASAKEQNCRSMLFAAQCKVHATFWMPARSARLLECCYLLTHATSLEMTLQMVALYANPGLDGLVQDAFSVC